MLKMQAMDYAFVLRELLYVKQLVKAINSLRPLLCQGINMKFVLLHVSCVVYGT